MEHQLWRPNVRGLTGLWVRAALTGLLAMLAACTASGSESEPSSGDARPSPTSEAGLMAACLQAKGWDIVVYPDDSYGIGDEGIPPEQVDQYFADQDECRNGVGAGQPPPPMTEAQAGKYFDDLVAVAECVRERGYPVGDPPSRQAAIEALMQPTINLGDWPYGPLQNSGITADELNELYAACPLPPRPD